MYKVFVNFSNSGNNRNVLSRDYHCDSLYDGRKSIDDLVDDSRDIIVDMMNRGKISLQGQQILCRKGIFKGGMIVACGSAIYNVTCHYGSYFLELQESYEV